MRNPVEIDAVRIRQQIQQNRAATRDTDEKIAIQVNAIDALKTLMATGENPNAEFQEHRLRLMESDLTALHLQKLRQSKIRAALRRLLSIVGCRLRDAQNSLCS